MFCGECGTQNPDTNQFCKNCGKPLRKTQQAPAAQPSAVPARPVAAQPSAQPAYYPPQPAVVLPQGAVAGAPAKPPLKKGMLVLGIIGILVGIGSWFRYPYLLGILAIILGGIVIAKTENRKGAVFIIGVIAVLIGLACIIFDMFYLLILPPVAPDL
ncbi:MAG: zinc-ribbon domain-containing protein [Methanoregulaceae archaeon]|nr:MAG: zinc-ribbon domain-containing protein [Methanoregulaceae archaeon]